MPAGAGGWRTDGAGHRRPEGAERAAGIWAAKEAAVKALNDKIMPIGAKMYEQASKDEAPASEDGDKKSDKDEPVEGEVVEDDKKDDK